MSRSALAGHPRVRMAAAGLAVISVLAMAGSLIGLPESVLGQESLSDGLRREVKMPTELKCSLISAPDTLHRTAA